MWETILIYTLIFIIGSFFFLLSEITYKKKSIRYVVKNYKGILAKGALIFLVFLVASFIYKFIGIEFK